MDIEKALSEAKQYIQQNQQSQARAILGEIIRQYPNSEQAWLLSARVTEKPEQVLYCIRRALEINPNSIDAREMITAIRQPRPSAISLMKSEPVIKPEPDTRPKQRLSHPSSNLPVWLDPSQQSPKTVNTTPPVNPNLLEHNPSTASEKTIKKYKAKWWYLILIVIGYAVTLWAIAYQFGDYIRFDEWQIITYGSTVPHDNQYGTQGDVYDYSTSRWISIEWLHRRDIYDNLPAVRSMEIVRSAGMYLGILVRALFLVWFFRGVIGGVVLANKKLRGGGWIWILILLPIVLYPAFLVFMGIFGEWAFAWGKNALYTRKKCPQCKGWIPREAIRCQHCGQTLPNI